MEVFLPAEFCHQHEPQPQAANGCRDPPIRQAAARLLGIEPSWKVCSFKLPAGQKPARLKAPTTRSRLRTPPIPSSEGEGGVQAGEASHLPLRRASARLAKYIQAPLPPDAYCLPSTEQASISMYYTAAVSKETQPSHDFVTRSLSLPPLLSLKL